MYTRQDGNDMNIMFRVAEGASLEKSPHAVLLHTYDVRK